MVVSNGVTRVAPGRLGDTAGVGYRFQLSQFDRVMKEIGGIVTGRQGRAGRAHEKMADWVRDRAIQILEDEIQAHGRGDVQRGTKHLIRAMQEPGFARADITGFTINPDDFLGSSSAALYWRGVELGSSKFVGREIHGYFKTGDKYASPNSLRRDMHLIQIGNTDGFKESAYKKRDYETAPTAGGVSGHTANPQNLGYRAVTQGGTFDPQHGPVGVMQGHGHTFSTEAGQEFHVRAKFDKRKKQKGKEDSGRFHHIIIHNPIPAYHYMTRAVEEFMRSGMAQQFYKSERVI